MYLIVIFNMIRLRIDRSTSCAVIDTRVRAHVGQVDLEGVLGYVASRGAFLVLRGSRQPVDFRGFVRHGGVDDGLVPCIQFPGKHFSVSVFRPVFFVFFAGYVRL